MDRKSIHKKRQRFINVKFDLFMLTACIATIGMGYYFDKRNFEEVTVVDKAEKTDKTENKEEKVVKKKYVEKVQVNKLETEDTTTSVDDDEGEETEENPEDSIPLYVKPDEESDVALTIFTGEWVDLVEQKGDFVKIRTKEGTEGYVVKELATIKKVAENPVPKSLKGAVIVIDAGHGGTDVGAESLNLEYKEKNLTLATAKVVKEKLQDEGAIVHMTRDTDKSVSLDERANIAIRQEPDAFISLHYDSNESDGAISGITTYYYYPSERLLGEAVNQGILDTAKEMDGIGTRSANYSLTRETPYPSLLIELGYMNNYQDLMIITDKDYYDQVSKGIVKGLKKYFASTQS